MTFRDRSVSVRYAALFCALLALAACGYRTRYSDPTEHNRSGSIGVGSKDFIEGVTQATTDMIAKVDRFQGAGQPPVIEFFSIQNNTNQPINKDMFLRRIRATMLQHAEGKFQFLDEAAVQRIDEIRAAKRAGKITAKEYKDLVGADLLLTGALDAISEVEGRYKSNYVQMTFRLTDAETGLVLWESLFEFKKERKDPWWKG